MQHAPEMPDFEQLAQLLDSTFAEVSASELHGVVCGLLCAGQTDAHSSWFEELFHDSPPNDLLVQEARQLVGQLYLATKERIRDTDLEFTPFLPSDGSAISRRARCLTEWCQGFLYGLALSEVDMQELEGDAQEAIADITEFTRLDHEAVQTGEESDAALMELEEFLRVAVLVIFEAMSGQREASHDSQ